MKLLSIIVPFHDSVHKCARLLGSLSKCEHQDVELVFVDDGSNDNTLEILGSFKNVANCAVTIIPQENKGPGGARNAGLDAAQGRYLWFVDSDDNIELDLALDVLRHHLDEDLDFIDFNIESGGKSISSMSVDSGSYGGGQDVRLLLAKRFGRIWSKIFHHRVFKQTGVRYPEFCIYEDNPLVFILPFCVKTFFKSDQCVYVHHEDHESVTRGRRSDRYFDRMLTAAWGYRMGRVIATTPEVAEVMKDHFIRLYLINTGQITSRPSLFWLEKLRVMRQFRTDAKEFAVVARLKDCFALMLNASWKYKLVFSILYMASTAIPPQGAHFRKRRFAAWGRPYDTRTLSLTI